MLSEDELDGTFEVIGSTAIPQAPHLPFYLPQILRAADGSIYLENHDGFTRTFSYHGLDLDDLAPYLALVSPIPARPHHRLMQLDADQEPQYLGDLEALRRLDDTGLHAIELALQALSEGDKGSAWAKALYAYNALPSYHVRPRLLLYCLAEAPFQRDKLERELAILPGAAIADERRHFRFQIEQHVTDINVRTSILDHPLMKPSPPPSSLFQEDPKHGYIRAGRKAQADANAA
jgi:hypothetical protein